MTDSLRAFLAVFGAHWLMGALVCWGYAIDKYIQTKKRDDLDFWFLLCALLLIAVAWPFVFGMNWGKSSRSRKGQDT
jgi:hypothetical protein